MKKQIKVKPHPGLAIYRDGKLHKTFFTASGACRNWAEMVAHRHAPNGHYWDSDKERWACINKLYRRALPIFKAYFNS